MKADATPALGDISSEDKTEVDKKDPDLHSASKGGADNKETRVRPKGKRQDL